MKFERVTYKPDGATRSRSTILRDPVELDTLGGVLTGVEVDREGSQTGSLKVSEQRHVINLALISKRVPLVMNFTYGRLEEQDVPDPIRDERTDGSRT